MRTRVIILVHGGNHLSVYLKSKEDAQQFVFDWVQRTKKRIESGDITSVETSLITDPEKCNSAVLLQYVLGMYIAEDRPDVQERMAGAAERMAKACEEGEDWKGS